MVCQPNSDILGYVNNLENLFTQQIEKISFMKTRLANFKNLLKEEEILSVKFNKAHEMNNQIYENQHSTSKNSNDCEIENY